LSASLERGRLIRGPKTGPDIRAEAGHSAVGKASPFQARRTSHGCLVTPAADAMYEFFDRLVAAALRPSRDFRGGLPSVHSTGGDYSLGVSDQNFPEIELGQDQAAGARAGHHDS